MNNMNNNNMNNNNMNNNNNNKFIYERKNRPEPMGQDPYEAIQKMVANEFKGHKFYVKKSTEFTESGEDINFVMANPDDGDGILVEIEGGGIATIGDRYDGQWSTVCLAFTHDGQKEVVLLDRPFFSKQ